MACTLTASLRQDKLSGWRDYLATAWVASGAAADAATAIVAVLA